MWTRSDEGLWSLNFWIPNYSVNLVTWEEGFSLPNAISRLEKLGWWCRSIGWERRQGGGLKALINCYVKKSGKIIPKWLCKMKSIITKVHVVPSNGNKMKCLYHNKNLQPILLTRKKKDNLPGLFFFLSLETTRFPKSCQQRKIANQAWLFICLCSVIFLLVS